MKIEFLKVERDCQHNKNIRNGQTRENFDCPTKVIYDYDVLVDGEHRATFCRDSSRRGYNLRTPDRKDPIEWTDTLRGNRRRSVVSDTKGEFLGKITTLIDIGELPTLAQIADRQAESARKKLASARRNRLEEIESIKARHGKDLYAILKKIYPSEYVQIANNENATEARSLLSEIEANFPDEIPD